jgi:thermitase
MSTQRFSSRRRTWSVVLLLTSIGLVGVGIDAPPISADGVLPEATGVIVALVPGASIDEVNARHGTVTIDTIPALGAHLLGWNDVRTTDTVALELELDPAVELADANRTTRAPEVAFSGRIYKWTSTPPGGVTTQWAAERIGLAAAHRVTTGAGVTVAVIDTGINASMPIFAGLIDPGVDFVDGDSTPGDDADLIDQNGNGVVDEAAGHGTHVAGLVHLVAPAAHIMPIRVLDSDGNSNTFTVAAAMLWAADHGADVVNLSLGQSGSSTLLRRAAELLSARDIVVVGAAGNEARSRDSFPAAAKCAISVTATTRDDRLADFASYASSTDIAAPGDELVSAFPFSPTGEASWSGTSMAAPLVAGEVALLRAARPDLHAGAISQVVVQSGATVPDAPGSVSGVRRIDVISALRRVRSITTNTSECLQ